MAASPAGSSTRRARSSPRQGRSHTGRWSRTTRRAGRSRSSGSATATRRRSGTSRRSRTRASSSRGPRTRTWAPSRARARRARGRAERERTATRLRPAWRTAAATTWTWRSFAKRTRPAPGRRRSLHGEPGLPFLQVPSAPRTLEPEVGAILPAGAQGQRLVARLDPQELPGIQPRPELEVLLFVVLHAVLARQAAV